MSDEQAKYTIVKGWFSTAIVDCLNNLPPEITEKYKDAINKVVNDYGKLNPYETCEKCFLIECCCEQDRLEGEQDRQKEIEMYHNAPVGSRLHRKIKECPCVKH